MDRIAVRAIVINTIFSKEGTEFQRMCDRFRARLHPGDSISTRAGGSHGDLSNDGYCPKARKFFACHATRGTSAQNIMDKITSDLEGCLSKWTDVQTWIFVTNDILSGEIPKFVDELRKKNKEEKNVDIEIWNKDQFADEIMKFDDDKVISEILDINLGNAFLAAELDESIEAEAINAIFDNVTARILARETKEAVDPDKDRRMKLKTKIQLNFKNEQEQESVTQFFFAALRLQPYIKDRMQIETPEMQEAISAYLFSKYDTLRSQQMESYAILQNLFQDFEQGAPNVLQNVIRAFVLFFFEDCTIFEKTPVEKRSNQL